ncbi:radical SAM protein, partial [candidate division CSSED10-310 bacterium]
IKPEKIQLNTLDRPGTESFIQAATNEELQQIVDLWQLPALEIIASSWSSCDGGSASADISNRILNTIARRPCTAADLAAMLGVNETEISITLSWLQNKNKIQTIKQQRGIFYRLG